MAVALGITTVAVSVASLSAVRRSRDNQYRSIELLPCHPKVEWAQWSATSEVGETVALMVMELGMIELFRNSVVPVGAVRYALVAVIVQPKKTAPTSPEKATILTT